MKQYTLHALFLALTVALMFTVGCKDDEVTPPAVFSINVGEVTVAVGADGTITLSGGTTPYSIKTGPDTSVATATLSGSTLSAHAVASGFTTLTVGDGAGAEATVNINVSGAITSELFPLVLGHQYQYSGYAISTSSATLPDPSKIYKTLWTVGATVSGATYLFDTTTFQHPSAGVITASRTLVLIKNTATGDFMFAQTLGPFFRAFSIARTDTVRFVSIAKPSLGIGGTWTAFDSTYVNGSSTNVRLEIFGEVLTGETITDSTTAHTKHNAIRFRTWRRITVGSTVAVDNATTSRLWLVKNIGPVIVHIAQDTENLGHFRVLQSKNF
ncbi:MAG: hypothetical protein HYZ33_01525 [Ignavibacteriales bacterium]|nr:hypothetical protein [Ignavibacteriales bacterium]